MFRNFHVWLWSLIMELEYKLYPWKDNTPPEWAISRYNLDHEIVDEYENHMYYTWIKSHDEKINRLQLEMLSVQKQLNEIEK